MVERIATVLDEPHGDEVPVIAEINMTNLVDVTLTLLVIFILVAPVVGEGMKVELPRASAGPLRADASVELRITRDGSLFIDGVHTSETDLAAALQRMTRTRRDGFVCVLSADKAVDYGRVVRILDLLGRLGYEDLALATTPDSSGASDETSER